MFYFNSSGTFSKLSTSLTLSIARNSLAATTISYNGVDYAIFSGGYGNDFSNTIDVFYFNSSGTFSKLSTSVTLSVGRDNLAATTISYNGVDYAIFGGGYTGSSSNVIDVFYFNSSGTFSRLSTSVSLSVGRRWLKATTITYNGVDYAIFGGGENNNGVAHRDIDVFYFNSSGTFSRLSTSLTLSVARYYLAATTISYNGVDYTIFGGGLSGSNVYSNTIDVFYFDSNGTFSRLNTSVSLSVGRSCLAVTSISYNGVDYAIFGGGYNGNFSNAIDVFYFNSGGTFSKLSTSLTLSVARYYLAATTISYNGVDYAIFGGGYNGNFSNAIDVFYFNSSGTFSKLSTSLTLSVARRYLAAATISYNNVDYAIFGGGNNSSSYYNTINVFCVK